MSWEHRPLFDLTDDPPLHTMDDPDDLRTCGHCREVVNIEDCDTVGAEPGGYMFCAECNGEIRIDTGEPIPYPVETKDAWT